MNKKIHMLLGNKIEKTCHYCNDELCSEDCDLSQNETWETCSWGESAQQIPDYVGDLNLAWRCIVYADKNAITAKGKALSICANFILNMEKKRGL